MLTDKDCKEITNVRKYFPIAIALLCQFHVLKRVSDSRISFDFSHAIVLSTISFFKFQAKEWLAQHKFDKELQSEVFTKFHEAVYSTDESEYELLKDELSAYPDGIGDYLYDNWFNWQPEMWRTIDRQHLFTIHTNTTNRLERLHRTMKTDLRGKVKLPELISALVSLSSRRAGERDISELEMGLRFPSTYQHPILESFYNTVTSYAYDLVAGQFSLALEKREIVNVSRQPTLTTLQTINFIFNYRLEITFKWPLVLVSTRYSRTCHTAPATFFQRTSCLVGIFCTSVLREKSTSPLPASIHDGEEAYAR